MTEDLHDIDDLFRDGLEGHGEEVPPEVWQAVSSGLDKKQASYYKHKYHRLKFAAAFLLLLCIAGAAYMTVHVVSDRHTTERKTSNTELTVAPASPQQEKHRPSSTVAGNATDLSQPDEQSVTAVTKNPLTSGPNVQATEPGQKVAKQAIRNDEFVTGKKQAGDGNALVFSPTVTVFDSPKQRQAVSKEKTGLPANRPEGKSMEEQPLAAAKEIFDLKYFSLPPKDLSLPAIDPQIFPQSLLPDLPPKKSSSQAKAMHGFSLSAFVAPNISFDRLEDDDRLAGPGLNRREAHRDEQKNNSFSAGLLVSYSLSSKLSLQSGVTVMSSSTAIAPKTVYAKADNNGHARYELHCSSGYVYISPEGGMQPVVGDSAQTVGTTSKLVYVSIPFALRYQIQVGRWLLSPTIGAGLNLLASRKTITGLWNPTGWETATASINGLRSSYLDGQIGMGIEYGLSKRFSIGVRPNARLALTAINRETPVRSYQNFLSLETGVRIKL